jgi:hypothetical protein
MNGLTALLTRCQSGEFRKEHDRLLLRCYLFEIHDLFRLRTNPLLL